MTKTSLLGPWVRRVLLEYLVSERNLARNTQRSYRDTLRLLLPFVARQTNGSSALFVGEKGGGRCRSVEKSKSGTFPPRLEIP